MEKYGIGNQITNKTSNVWMIKNFLVNRENFKVLVYWYYFGANVDREKLLSVWSEKNMLCVWFILNV